MNFERIQHLKNLTPPYSWSRIKSNEFRINFHQIFGIFFALSNQSNRKFSNRIERISNEFQFDSTPIHNIKWPKNKCILIYELCTTIINKIRAIENHNGAKGIKINLSIQQQQQPQAAAEMAHCCQFLSPLFNSCARGALHSIRLQRLADGMPGSALSNYRAINDTSMKYAM